VAAGKIPSATPARPHESDEVRRARLLSRANAERGEGERIDDALKPRDAAPKPEPTAEEKAAAARAQREIAGSVMAQAQSYRDGKAAPTGAWPASAELGAGAALAGDGTTALVGKKKLMMTRDKLDRTNEVLALAGARLGFAAGESTTLASGETLVEAKLALTVPDNGPTQALHAQRAAPVDVTYADCQRNATVSAGFDYVPGGRDCQQPVIPPGALGGAEPIATPKMNDLKALMKVATRSSYDDAAFGRMDRFTNSAGERQARSVVGAAIPNLLTDYPELQGTMDGMDALTQRRGGKELEKITEEELGKHRDKPGLESATWPDVEQQKAAMVETKKVWNKYALLSQCADGMKVGRDPKDIKVDIRNAAVKGLLTNLDERGELDRLLENRNCSPYLGERLCG
jgi:hypothetical protein